MVMVYRNGHHAAAQHRDRYASLTNNSVELRILSADDSTGETG